MWKLIEWLLIWIPVLLSIAFFTLSERKVLASIQLRQGPNLIGLYGTGQPFSDALKLLSKETIWPNHANLVIFLIAPIFALTIALINWVIIPFEKGIHYLDIHLGVLYIIAISSLAVYGVLFSGWASNSQYAFLGSLRSTAQIISYEVTLGLLLLCIVISNGTINITELVISQKYIWYGVPYLIVLFLYSISILAETNRTPFDLPEGESELVSGYNVEYSSIAFALFFLAEYVHIIFNSVFISLLFLGGWLPPFNFQIFYWIPGTFWLIFKTSFIIYIFLWVRGTLPRYRYDQLISLVWKVYLPYTLGIWIWISSILYIINWLPPYQN